MRHTFGTLGRRRWRPVTAIAVAFALSAGAASTALAATVSPVNTTFDRPGITADPAGGYDIAWAGEDANGSVNGAGMDGNGNIGGKWTDRSSSTAPGTGVAITWYGPIDTAVLAWTDLGTTVHVAAFNAGGPACESTGFGTSVDTPYLTVASNGNIYLTTVTGGGVMHVTQVVQQCLHEAGLFGSFSAAGQPTTVAGNATFVGPTLFDLSQNGAPDLWLVWAGVDSNHSINIARFIPGDSALGTKFTERNHSTITDMGSTGTTQGAGFFSYCGTNNVVFGQNFTGTGPLLEQPLGGSCSIFTSGQGFINGGVDVAWTGKLLTDLFPDKSTGDLVTNSF